MEGIISDIESVRAEKTIGTLLVAIEAASWFAAVGAPSTPQEDAEVAAYLLASGHASDLVRWTRDWAEARDCLLGADWDRNWWQNERDERARLYEHVRRSLGEREALTLLTRVTDLAARLLHGPAAVAAACDGVADPGLVRVATGSAAEACYHMALARLVDADDAHPFASRFRLFEAGRWPLIGTGGIFHIF